MADDLVPFDPDPLAVGDRVTVRLSGECDGWGNWDGLGALDHETHNEDGRVGVIGGFVDPEEFPEGADGHPYWLLFDDGSESQDYYARAELTRADPPAR